MADKKTKKPRPVHVDQSNPGPVLTTEQYEKYYGNKQKGKKDDNHDS